jgi:hypothetical protein
MFGSTSISAPGARSCRRYWPRDVVQSGRHQVHLDCQAAHRFTQGSKSTLAVPPRSYSKSLVGPLTLRTSAEAPVGEQRRRVLTPKSIPMPSRAGCLRSRCRAPHLTVIGVGHVPARSRQDLAQSRPRFRTASPHGRSPRLPSKTSSESPSTSPARSRPGVRQVSWNSPSAYAHADPTISGSSIALRDPGDRFHPHASCRHGRPGEVTQQ